MQRFSDLKALYQTMGVLRFCIFFAGITAMLVGSVHVESWLSAQIGWPENYGFHCSGRKCWLVEKAYSGRLLRTGSFYELLLFAWMWLIPVALAAIGVYLWLEKWMVRRRGRIRPLR